MKKMVLIIIISVITLALIILLTGKVVLASKFDKEVKELFNLPQDSSNKTFHYEQISQLPEPVQRYFKNALKEGLPYIKYVRLKHDGQFKASLDQEWMDIKGEQYFTAEKPGFIWKGKTSLFTARDMYIADSGRLVVSLMSVYNIVDAHGEKYDQGELLRWLGEAAWFPTSLLPNEYLEWSPIDHQTAKLTFEYNDLSIFYIVTFNEKGEITEMETQRYMGEENLETWIGKLSAYKEIEGVVVPTIIEGIWRLDTGDFSYAKFNVKELEYNVPEKYR